MGALSQNSTMIKVTKLKRLGGYRLHATFSDGTAGEYDFSALVDEAGPMFKPCAIPHISPAYSWRMARRPGRTASTSILLISTCSCATPAR